MGVPTSGHNARIQIDTDVIANANTWNLGRTVPTSDASQFAETHGRNVPGQRADTGSLNAWQPTDAKVLNDASGTEGRLWIYPFFTTAPTAYWYGVVLFTDYTSDGNLTSSVSATLNFVNANFDGTGMAAFGFA